MGSQVNIENLDNKPEGDDTTRKTSAPRQTAASAAKQQRNEKELRGRIDEVLDRIATSREARGDERLADIIRDDAQVMAGFLVSFTRPFGVLRTTLVTLLALIEPALAFGRLFRELAGRWAERRQAEKEEQQRQRPPDSDNLF